jgi:hypothetical protein
MERSLAACTQVHTWAGDDLLTTASGFFFRRDEALFLVTSRHVLFDEPSSHRPDRVSCSLHTDHTDLTRVVTLSLPLYSQGLGAWRQGEDSGGPVDIAALRIDASVLPAPASFAWFDRTDLPRDAEEIELGTAVLIIGFPLGFHDTQHHLPIARQGAVASAFGVRFQGQGYFLTDARTHRGMSGAPVVMRPAAGAGMRLLAVHSSTMDMAGRNATFDEALGLNCAWYADILPTLTRD